MPKVLPAVFSYEGMKEKWNEDNPDDPYNRRADLETGRYALDKWLIRLDDEGKTIATIAWKEHPNHIVVGGLRATKRGREIGGNSADLDRTRQPQLPDKPLVSAFGIEEGDNEQWMASGRSKGWAFPNDAKFQEYSQLIPQEVLNDWLSKYPDNMGIRPNNPEDMAKGYYLDDIMDDWFNVVKSERYSRALGEKGYDVIDSRTGKRVNKTALSKSRADVMLEAIKRGETDLTQYETKVKRKAKHSNWKNILQRGD